MINVTCDAGKVEEIKDYLKAAFFGEFPSFCEYLENYEDDELDDVEEDGCAMEMAEQCFSDWLQLQVLDNVISINIDEECQYWPCIYDNISDTIKKMLQNVLEDLISHYSVKVSGYVGYHSNHASLNYWYSNVNDKIVRQYGAHCPVCNKIKPVTKDLEKLVVNDFTERFVCSEECLSTLTSGKVNVRYDEDGGVEVNGERIYADILDAVKMKYSR